MMTQTRLTVALVALCLGAPARAADLSCYGNAAAGAPGALSANRDRLIADLARRKATGSCVLWASLNKAERYIFLMDTAYLGDKSSRLYPPASGNLETALDHAAALYSINGPKAGEGIDHSGRGGEDYNRIYLGFDSLAACVMRQDAQANPAHDPDFNQWRRSDDGSGPHKPFTAREMIRWGSWTDDEMLNSLGPQFHHWAGDGDVNVGGLAARMGVCGVSDPSLTELTVAFDFYHNSDPLGDYASRGGRGWQIVDKHVVGGGQWDYAPAGCAATPPVNDDLYGGGTFNGLGSVLRGGVCEVVPAGAPARAAPVAVVDGPALKQLVLETEAASPR